jgi:hypothetical protein
VSSVGNTSEIEGGRLATAKKRSRGEARVGFFECLRDVLIASLVKGQFPAALVAMIVLSMIWRMPPTDLSQLVRRLFDIAEKKSLVGYGASAAFLSGWFFSCPLPATVDQETRIG